MGLKGLKLILILCFLPSEVMISPQYIMRPFGGTLEYSLRCYWVEVMADKTDRRLTCDLILKAVPYFFVSDGNLEL